MSRNASETHGQNFLACCIKRRNSMTKIKLLSAGLIAAAMLATPVMGGENYAAKQPLQQANGENSFPEMYPNRDVLNGGVLTPAGRMGLELANGAASVYAADKAHVLAADNAYAEMGSAGPSFRARRYRSYDHATDSLLGYDGRRHPSR
jgi:hypothetical protein